jgi:hypothetical protein
MLLPRLLLLSRQERGVSGLMYPLSLTLLVMVKPNNLFCSPGRDFDKFLVSRGYFSLNVWLLSTSRMEYWVLMLWSQLNKFNCVWKCANNAQETIHDNWKNEHLTRRLITRVEHFQNCCNIFITIYFHNSDCWSTGITPVSLKRY